MSGFKRQKENVLRMFELLIAYPNLRVIPMVDTEVVASDDHSWWIAEWGKASVEEIYSVDERVYIRSTDEDTLIEDLLDDTDEYADEDYAYEQAEKQVDNYDWERVIAVKITV